MSPYRMSSRVAAVICLACLLLTSCAAVNSLLGSDDAKDAVGGALDTATTVANASGSPILLGIVGILNGLFAIWAGKRAAKKLDAQDWSDDDVNTLVVALRAKGYQVNR